MKIIYLFNRQILFSILLFTITSCSDDSPDCSLGNTKFWVRIVNIPSNLTILTINTMMYHGAQYELIKAFKNPPEQAAIRIENMNKTVNQSGNTQLEFAFDEPVYRTNSFILTGCRVYVGDDGCPSGIRIYNRASLPLLQMPDYWLPNCEVRYTYDWNHFVNVGCY